MNATQRKFLVEKLQEQTKKKISDLKDSKQKYPSASNYIFKAVMNDTIELQSEAEIIQALKQKALNAKEGSNWLSEDYMGANKENSIRINLKSLIKLPKDYEEELIRVREFNQEVDEKIKNLETQLNTLEIRIQLASDKVLQTLVNDVDDLGDLKLVDIKIKALNG
jgi:hypothetical protein